jgi:putative oxidoreductase
MQYGQWIGRTALALVFLFNALGIVDQTRPARELAAHGAPAALVPTLIMAGRALQLVAGIALVIGWHERIAALLLALFLIPATLTAHDFWAAAGPEFQGQLVNFLKNLAMFGGLCFVAFRLPPAAEGAPRVDGSLPT